MPKIKLLDVFKSINEDDGSATEKMHQYIVESCGSIHRSMVEDEAELDVDSCEDPSMTNEDTQGGILDATNIGPRSLSKELGLSFDFIWKDKNKNGFSFSTDAGNSDSYSELTRKISELGITNTKIITRPIDSFRTKLVLLVYNTEMTNEDDEVLDGPVEDDTTVITSDDDDLSDEDRIANLEDELADLEARLDAVFAGTDDSSEDVEVVDEGSDDDLSVALQHTPVAVLKKMYADVDSKDSTLAKAIEKRLKDEGECLDENVELKTVSLPANTEGRYTDGKKAGQQNDTSVTLQKSIDKRQGGQPATIMHADDFDKFELETPPPSKKLNLNNVVQKGGKVDPKGDKNAMLNKNDGRGPENTKSTID